MPDDRRLSRAVEKALTENESTAGLQSLHVSARAGVVFLDGEVGSKDQREAAVALAKKVEGVRLVRDRVQINPEARAGGWRAPHQHEE